MTARRVVQVVLAIGLLAALAITTSVTGAAPASAAVASPTGLTPASGTVNANPVFAWSAVRGATGYEVQLAEDAAFNHVLLDQTMANRQYTPTDQLPMQKIYWRVRATDQNGVSSRWSTTAAFTRSTLAGPTPVLPVNGTHFAPPISNPLLTWKAVPGASRYLVYVDDSADFLGAEPIYVQTTSLLYPAVQDASSLPYYWKVRAEVGSGQLTAASATGTYFVDPTGDITGASPDVDANGVEPEVEQVVLRWNPLPGAVSYDLRVSTDVNFPDNTIIDQRSVVGTAYSPSTTYDVDEYYWQVRPRNAFGKPKAWNAVPIHRFSRTYFTTDNARTATTTVPTLLYPADAVSPPVYGDFYYQWTPARLASRYELQVGDDPNFSPGRYVSCTTTQTTYVPGIGRDGGTGCLPGVGGRVFWRVRALDDPRPVNGRWSAIHQFVFSEDGINQVAPANGDTVSVPALSWELSENAVRYRVRITDKDGAVTSTDTSSNSWTPTGRLDPAKSPFHWTVQGIDQSGRVTPLPIIDDSRTFTLVAAPPASAGAPVATAPTVGSSPTNRFPALRWTPVTGATSYRVYVGPAGGQFLSPLADTFSYPSATDTSSDTLSPGNYDWFVIAYNSQNQAISNGPRSSFGIAPLGVVGGQRVALDGSGLGPDGHPCKRTVGDDSLNVCSNLLATPTLDWDPVVGAGYYLVYLSRDRNFQNVFSISETLQSRWASPSTLPDSQAGSAYYWFVRPCKTPGNCAPDPTLAQNAFDKLSAPVAQLSVTPTTGTTPTSQNPTQVEDSSEITFAWQDYLTTNLATSGTLTQEHPEQAARYYQVQVATNPNFANIIDDQTVDQTTYTANDRLYPDGPLYVRVRAIDGSSFPLPWNVLLNANGQPILDQDGNKVPLAFRKSSPAPHVVTPAVSSSQATSNLTQTEPFVWSPAEFAARYDVQIYKNADTTASPANLVTLPNGNIGQTAGTLDRPLASGLKYAWRVRRFDASGNPGSWSPWGLFKVTGKAPAQSSPATGALVSSTSSLFRWAPVPTAYKYRFERRIANSSTVLDTVDTVMPAWAFPNPMQTGNYEWRVSTIDTNNQIVASSPWRRFRVDSTAPVVTKVSPQSPFARTANIDLHFSETIRGASTNTIKLRRSGTVVSIPIKVTTRGSLVIINPKQKLAKATSYDVVVKAGLRDTSGLPFQPYTVQVGTK